MHGRWGPHVRCRTQSLYERRFRAASEISDLVFAVATQISCVTVWRHVRCAQPARDREGADSVTLHRTAAQRPTSSGPRDAAPSPAPLARPWWRDAVTYQVYVRSFADGNGDGVGDLQGIRSRLPYLADLGVDAIWLTPFYPSPLVDGGYDVSDYRAVDPLLGTLADFDALIKDGEAHQIRVIVDIVPNHCSSAHPLFQAALAAAPGSRERARFIFRDGRGPGGE